MNPLNRIVALLLVPCLISAEVPRDEGRRPGRRTSDVFRAPELGPRTSPFASQALANSPGFSGVTGTRAPADDAERAAAASRGARSGPDEAAEDAALFVASRFGPTRLDPLVIQVALDMFRDDAANEQVIERDSGLAGMLRFAQRLHYFFTGTSQSDPGDLPLSDLYENFGSPEAVNEWTRSLNLTPGELNWEPLPATYNIFEKAANELIRNPALYAGEGEARFIAYLENKEKLGLSPEDARRICSIFAGPEGMAVLQVLFGPSLFKLVLSLNWTGRAPRQAAPEPAPAIEPAPQIETAEEAAPAEERNRLSGIAATLKRGWDRIFRKLSVVPTRLPARLANQWISDIARRLPTATKTQILEMLAELEFALTDFAAFDEQYLYEPLVLAVAAATMPFKDNMEVLGLGPDAFVRMVKKLPLVKPEAEANLLKIEAAHRGEDGRDMIGGQRLADFISGELILEKVEDGQLLWEAQGDEQKADLALGQNHILETMIKAAQTYLLSDGLRSEQDLQQAVREAGITGHRDWNARQLKLGGWLSMLPAGLGGEGRLDGKIRDIPDQHDLTFKEAVSMIEHLYGSKTRVSRLGICLSPIPDQGISVDQPLAAKPAKTRDMAYNDLGPAARSPEEAPPAIEYFDRAMKWEDILTALQHHYGHLPEGYSLSVWVREIPAPGSDTGKEAVIFVALDNHQDVRLKTRLAVLDRCRSLPVYVPHSDLDKLDAHLQDLAGRMDPARGAVARAALDRASKAIRELVPAAAWRPLTLTEAEEIREAIQAAAGNQDALLQELLTDPFFRLDGRPLQAILTPAPEEELYLPTGLPGFYFYRSPNGSLEDELEIQEIGQLPAGSKFLVSHAYFYSQNPYDLSVQPAYTGRPTANHSQIEVQAALTRRLLNLYPDPHLNPAKTEDPVERRQIEDRIVNIAEQMLDHLDIRPWDKTLVLSPGLVLPLALRGAVMVFVHPDHETIEAVRRDYMANESLIEQAGGYVYFVEGNFSDDAVQGFLKKVGPFTHLLLPGEARPNARELAQCKSKDSGSLYLGPFSTESDWLDYMGEFRGLGFQWHPKYWEAHTPGSAHYDSRIYLLAERGDPTPHQWHRARQERPARRPSLPEPPPRLMRSSLGETAAALWASIRFILRAPRFAFSALLGESALMAAPVANHTQLAVEHLSGPVVWLMGAGALVLAAISLGILIYNLKRKRPANTAAVEVPPVIVVVPVVSHAPERRTERTLHHRPPRSSPPASQLDRALNPRAHRPRSAKAPASSSPTAIPLEPPAPIQAYPKEIPPPNDPGWKIIKSEDKRLVLSHPSGWKFTEGESIEGYGTLLAPETSDLGPRLRFTNEQGIVKSICVGPSFITLLEKLTQQPAPGAQERAVRVRKPRPAKSPSKPVTEPRPARTEQTGNAPAAEDRVSAKTEGTTPPTPSAPEISDEEIAEQMVAWNEDLLLQQDGVSRSVNFTELSGMFRFAKRLADLHPDSPIDLLRLYEADVEPAPKDVGWQPTPGRYADFQAAANELLGNFGRYQKGIGRERFKQFLKKQLNLQDDVIEAICSLFSNPDQGHAVFQVLTGQHLPQLNWPSAAADGPAPKRDYHSPLPNRPPMLTHASHKEMDDFIAMVQSEELLPDFRMETIGWGDVSHQRAYDFLLAVRKDEQFWSIFRKLFENGLPPAPGKNFPSFRRIVRARRPRSEIRLPAKGHASDRGGYTMVEEGDLTDAYKRLIEPATIVEEFLAFMGQSPAAGAAFDLVCREWLANDKRSIKSLLDDPYLQKEFKKRLQKPQVDMTLAQAFEEGLKGLEAMGGERDPKLLTKLSMQETLSEEATQDLLRSLEIVVGESYPQPVEKQIKVELDYFVLSHDPSGRERTTEPSGLKPPDEMVTVMENSDIEQLTIDKDVLQHQLGDLREVLQHFPGILVGIEDWVDSKMKADDSRRLHIKWGQIGITVTPIVTIGVPGQESHRPFLVTIEPEWDYRHVGDYFPFARGDFMSTPRPQPRKYTHPADSNEPATEPAGPPADSDRSDSEVILHPEDLTQTGLPQVRGRIEETEGVLSPAEMTSQMFLNFIPAHLTAHFWHQIGNVLAPHTILAHSSWSQVAQKASQPGTLMPVHGILSYVVCYVVFSMLFVGAIVLLKYLIALSVPDDSVLPATQAIPAIVPASPLPPVRYLQGGLDIHQLLREGHAVYQMEDGTQFLFRLKVGRASSWPRFSRAGDPFLNGLGAAPYYDALTVDAFHLQASGNQFIGRMDLIRGEEETLVTEPRDGYAAVYGEQPVSDGALTFLYPGLRGMSLLMAEQEHKTGDMSRRDDPEGRYIPPSWWVREEYRNWQLGYPSSEGFQGIGKSLITLADAAAHYYFGSMDSVFEAPDEPPHLAIGARILRPRTKMLHAFMVRPTSYDRLSTVLITRSKPPQEENSASRGGIRNLGPGLGTLRGIGGVLASLTVLAGNGWSQTMQIVSRLLPVPVQTTGGISHTILLFLTTLAAAIPAAVIYRTGRYGLPNRPGPEAPLIAEARHLMRRQDYETAWDVIQKGRRLYPKNPILLGLAATTAAHLDDFETAIDLAYEAVEGTPYDPHAWGILGNVLYMAGDVEEALRANAEEIQLRPHRAQGYGFRAQLFLSLWEITQNPMDLARAVTNSLTEVAVSPTNGSAHGFLSRLYEHQGLVGKAMAEREKEVDLLPWDGKARSRLFWLYWKRLENLLGEGALASAHQLLRQAAQRLQGADLAKLQEPVKAAQEAA